MSIHSKWAELIYSGKKTIELRKSKPIKKSEWNIAVVYLYETDKKKITGCFHTEINNILEIKSANHFLYNRAGMNSISELLKYMNGKKVYGWKIKGYVKFHKELELRHFNLKRAPQSWQYTNY